MTVGFSPPKFSFQYIQCSMDPYELAYVPCQYLYESSKNFLDMKKDSYTYLPLRIFLQDIPNHSFIKVRLLALSLLPAKLLYLMQKKTGGKYESTAVSYINW